MHDQLVTLGKGFQGEQGGFIWESMEMGKGKRKCNYITISNVKVNKLVYSPLGIL